MATMLSVGASELDPLSQVVVVLQELASIYHRTSALAGRGWTGGVGREQGLLT